MKKIYFVIMAITFYRLAITPVLIALIFSGRQEAFALMLAISFFTDLIDGVLARTFNVASTFGSRLDSIADDLTFFTAIVACFVFKYAFLENNRLIVGTLLALYLIQTLCALIRYHKISSFHTYLAKIAAILQGVFLILLFLLKEPPLLLFYIASAVTSLDLIEEIILVFMLPEWATNVKGVYWICKRKTDKTIRSAEGEIPH